MKPFLGAGLMFVLAAGSAVAQDTKLYSTPELPSREVLDRLNMRMAWHINVPMDGRRDGFVSIQVDNGQIIVATRGGAFATYDAETGRELWKIVLGKPNETSFTPTFNSKSIFFVRGGQLYSLDRYTGAVQWQLRLLFDVATAPVADERQIFVTGRNTEIAAFQLPQPGELGTPTTSGLDSGVRVNDASESLYQQEREARGFLIRPYLRWRTTTDLRLNYTPTVTREVVFYATDAGGYLFAMSKDAVRDQASEIYRVQIAPRLLVPPATYDEIAYVPTSDTTLVAIQMANGRVRWRFSPGGDVTRQPFVTSNDIYLTVEHKGLLRLDRETGKPQWKLPFGRTTTDAAPEADRVIAVNDKYVYATDRAGRMLVLERKTGRQMSYYTPFRDFVFPVSNDVTDRLVLAANNGLIVCLHDREYEKPLALRKSESDLRPSENRLKSLKDKLARKVSDKAVDALPLGDVIDSFRRKYNIDIAFTDRPFIDAGLEPVRNQPVTQPQVENLELGEVLKGLLAKVNATYEIVGDVVVVIPAKKVVAEAPGMNPAENIDPKIKEILTKRVDAPAVDKYTLNEVLLEVYGLRFPEIKFDVDEKAFKALGIESQDVLKKEITHPKGKGLVFDKVLHDILAQAQADFVVRGDKIVIIPAKK